jgi:hypothetical protein
MSAHASSNIITDGLAFMYDTGDGKSYRGEPAVNLWDSMLNTQSLRSHTKHYWNGQKWEVNATYSHPGVAGPKGIYLGLVFKHTSGSLNSTWSGNSYGYMLRDIVCTSGATFTQSCWVYASENCDVTAIPSVIEGESGGETTVTGYQASYDLTNKGTWQVTSKKATSDGNTRFIPLYPRKNGVADGSFNGFFMWALPQVVAGSNVVKPIQPGTTRSSTQGLLDRTGSSTIDLSNASFDSNAQMTFDGTDDYAAIPYSSTDLDGDAIFSVEAIIKRTGTMSNGGIWGIGGDATAAGINGYVFTSAPNKITIDLWGTATFHAGVDYPLNEYVHIMWVKTATGFSTSTIIIYVNGVAYTGSNLTVMRGSSHTPNLNTSTSGKGIVIGRVGPATNSYYAQGELPILKIYNKALTAAEVTQNYNAIKDRFIR